LQHAPRRYSRRDGRQHAGPIATPVPSRAASRVWMIASLEDVGSLFEARHPLSFASRTAIAWRGPIHLPGPP
jgi:hypothetical protein